MAPACDLSTFTNVQPVIAPWVHFHKVVDDLMAGYDGPVDGKRKQAA